VRDAELDQPDDDEENEQSAEDPPHRVGEERHAWIVRPPPPFRKHSRRPQPRFAALLGLAGVDCLGKTGKMLRRDLPGAGYLRLLDESDAEELYALVDANRAYLARWLPWVEAAGGPEYVLNFIRATRRQLADDDGFQTAIVEDKAIIGVVGFHAVDWRNLSTSIGYWLAENRQGRGTMTEAVRALADHAFVGWNLNRIEIRVAAENLRSRAIPSRLGFIEEGVLRQAERFGERFEDSVVYSMLAKDWP
jgi:ribosomal-protein-serine acetyltransferase